MGNTVLPMVSGIAEFIMRAASAILLPRVSHHGIPVGGGSHLQHAVKLVGGGEAGDKDNTESHHYKKTTTLELQPMQLCIL